MLELEIPITEQSTDMPSLNHSYLCSRILRQLFQYPAVEALTELTIDVDKGLTLDISVYPAGVLRPNFSRDITRMPDLPLLAIEVISASQNIQDVLEKAERMVKAGVPTVWTVEPFTRAIFVTDAQGETLFYRQKIAIEGISVDFAEIFAD